MSVFLSTIKNSKPENQAGWWLFCQRNEGRKIRVETVETLRTLTQNAFYWHYLEVIASETGNEPDDLHEYFKSKLLPRKFVKIKGRHGEYDFEKLGTTTKLTKTEMGEYMEKICAATQVPIPNPEEVGYLPN